MSRGLRGISRLVGAIGLALAVSGCAAAPTPRISRVPVAFTTPGDADAGILGGMVVPVAYQGRVGYLAIDTGSALTFLYLGEDGPEYKPRAGRVRIGAETLTLPGRNFDADDETEIGIVGVLGADYFVDRPCVFEPAGARITRFPDPAAPPPPPPSNATRVPFEIVAGHVILRLRVDGRTLRLMWDTGCPHLLWLGQEGRAGDEAITGEDVEGGRFPMYLGSAALELPGEPPRQVATLRVPRFPYFEGTVEALGGEIDGLAGQSVLGARSLTFDVPAGVIHVGSAAP